MFHLRRCRASFLDRYARYKWKGKDDGWGGFDLFFWYKMDPCDFELKEHEIPPLLLYADMSAGVFL